MSSVALALRQVRYENKTFWRNPASAFFTFAFPLIFLVIFNAVFGNGTVEVGGHVLRRSNFYVPAIATFSVISACFTNIAMSISYAREQGVLKRKLATPVPRAAYLGGRVLHATLMMLLLVAIVVLAGKLFYGVRLPTRTLPAFLATLVLGSAAFCSLGLAITAAVPNAVAAPAVVNAVILPLLFISDVFFGPEASPAWLKNFADLFPVRPYLTAMLHSFNPYETGSGFAWPALARVGGWGLAGAILAAKFFRWEPRR